VKLITKGYLGEETLPKTPIPRLEDCDPYALRRVRTHLEGIAQTAMTDRQLEVWRILGAFLDDAIVLQKMHEPDPSKIVREPKNVVLKLRDDEKKTFREVAASLNVSLPSARRRYRRAKWIEQFGGVPYLGEATNRSALVKFLPRDLIVRVIDGLERAGIITIGDLAQHSDDSLFLIKNFGRKSIKAVRLAVEDWRAEHDGE
jgi:hypothetical protein